GTVRVNSGARFALNNCSQSLARIEGSGTFAGVNPTTSSPLLSVTSAIAPGMGADSLGTLTLDGGINIADDTVLEIDVAPDGTSDCFSYPAQLDLSKMTLQVNDLAKLNNEKKYVIARLPNGWNGEFKSTNLDDNWRVKFRTGANQIEVVHNVGFMLIVK
ncbi:MAG: hypothetical protein IKO55_09485, partial [Kiritimatiellae bacterium]|nr:hypothetical protein [Kiritimatiellia bacterium]